MAKQVELKLNRDELRILLLALRFRERFLQEKVHDIDPEVAKDAAGMLRQQGKLFQKIAAAEYEAGL